MTFRLSASMNSSIIHLRDQKAVALLQCNTTITHKLFNVENGYHCNQSESVTQQELTRRSQQLCALLQGLSLGVTCVLFWCSEKQRETNSNHWLEWFSHPDTARLTRIKITKPQRRKSMLFSNCSGFASFLPSTSQKKTVALGEQKNPLSFSNKPQRDLEITKN